MFDRPIRFAARHVPHLVAVSTGTAHVTYRQLDRAVDQVGAALAAAVAPGAIVGVSIADGYVHALVTLACARLGAATTSLSPPMARAMVPLTGATVLVADDPAAGGQVTVDRAWLDAALSGEGAAAALPRLAIDPAAVGRVQLSSGSTGVPKAAALSWAMLEMRAANSVLTGGGQARSLSLIGPESGSLQSWLSTWRARGTVLLSAGQLDVLAAALPVLAPTMILAAPAQLAALLDALPAEAAPLAGLTVVLTGGQASRALCDRAAIRLGASVATAYASTEAGVMALGFAARLPADGAVGFVTAATDLEIVDADGGALGPGETGLIRIAGPEVVDGYRDGPGEAFRDGWFYPGDLGSLDADGCLRIVGRADEIINVGGEKVAPEALEELVRPVAGVADVAAFALPGEAGDQPWLAIVRAGDIAEGDIARALTLPGLGTVRIAWIEAIPRTPMGKVRREELQAAAAKL